MTSDRLRRLADTLAHVAADLREIADAVEYAPHVAAVNAALDAATASLPPVDARRRITERQRICLNFIERSIAIRGFPPTLREIGAHMGIRSTNGVNDHLRALERKGYITREGLSARGLRVAPASEVESGDNTSDDNAEVA